MMKLTNYSSSFITIDVCSLTYAPAFSNFESQQSWSFTPLDVVFSPIWVPIAAKIDVLNISSELGALVTTTNYPAFLIHHNHLLAHNLAAEKLLAAIIKFLCIVQNIRKYPRISDFFARRIY